MFMKAGILLLSLSLMVGGVSFAANDLPEEAQQLLLEENAQKLSESLPATDRPQAESEIPLNLEPKKQAVAQENPWLRVTLGLGVLAILSAGALFWVKKHGRPGQRQNAPQIKILNQHWLGPKKSLAIVRVAGESILIGVTEQNISMLKSLSLLDDEVPVETPDQFDRVLATEESANLEAEDGEDFMMGGLAQVKQSVARRLKGMRSLQ